MDSHLSHECSNPKRLKDLSSLVQYPEGNSLLHKFVLDNSDPFLSCSENSINAALISMSSTIADANALNDEGYSPLHLAVLKNNLLMVKKLLSCLNIDVDAKSNFEKGEKTALHLAVESDDVNLDIIQELLNKGAEVNMKNRYNCTALCSAVMSGNLTVIKLLINGGANVNLRSDWGFPLHYAAKSGNLATVKFLINNGSDVNSKSKNGFPPLFYAAESGSLATVEFLVSSGTDLSSERTVFIFFYQAIKAGNLDVIKILLDAGVNVNFKNDINLLFLAAKLGNLAAVEFLVNKGSDINAKNEYEQTPIFDAVTSDNLAVVEFLINKGADLNTKDRHGQTPIFNAVRFGNLAIVEFLVSKGSDINIKNRHAQTPIFKAVKIGNLPIVQFLVSKGSDVNAKDENEQTPIFDAVTSNNLAVVAFLINKGADFNAKDRDGQTPIFNAASSDNLDILEFLINKGADINTKDTHGRTPIFNAVRYGNLATVQFLVSKGTDINISDNDLAIENFCNVTTNLHGEQVGKTLLHFAMYRKNLEIAKFLLDKGANLQVMDRLGFTLLHEAVIKRSVAFTKLFIERGADVNAKDVIYGFTPLLYLLDFIKHRRSHDRDYFQMCELILERNADLSAEDESGKTVLQQMIQINDFVLTELILEIATKQKNIKNGETPLPYPVESGLYDAIKLFVEKGVEQNFRDSSYTILLRHAVDFNYKSIVDLYLENGADLNAIYNNRM